MTISKDELWFATQSLLPTRYRAGLQGWRQYDLPVPRVRTALATHPSSIGATGLFTNHDYLTDSIGHYLLTEGAGLYSLESIGILADWLASLPPDQWGFSHGQSLPAMGLAAVLYANNPGWSQKYFAGFLRWYATIQNSDMLKSRVGMTSRPWFNLLGSSIRGIFMLERFINPNLYLSAIRSEWVPKDFFSEGVLPPRELLEKILDAFVSWCSDRGELGGKGEEGRGFTRPLDHPWRIARLGDLTVDAETDWPYFSFGSPTSIADNDQPFMFLSFWPRNVQWANAYLEDAGLSLPIPIRIRGRELADWSLSSFYDPETRSSMQALHRGTFRPDALPLPFREWELDDKDVEGELDHSIAGAIQLSHLKGGAKRRLLRRLLGTATAPAHGWLQTGELDCQTVLSVEAIFGKESDAEDTD